MLLKDKKTGTLIKIVEVEQLFIPTEEAVDGQMQNGQNEQPPSSFNKQDLIFPSGEDLPQCWVDPDYRKNMPPQPQS